jgi:hypothetical protein
LQGIAILKILALDELFDNYEIFGLEDRLYQNLHGSYFFKGFVDVIVKHKKTNRVTILDWKTSTTNWDISKKMSDKFFKLQMLYYKLFIGRKHNIPLSNIDTVYIVLNRLDKSKKNFPGIIQKVPVISNYNEIKEATTILANTINKIHKQHIFEKAKFRKNSLGNTNENWHCKFCPLKGGVSELCNDNEYQYRELLAKHPKP